MHDAWSQKIQQLQFWFLPHSNQVHGLIYLPTRSTLCYLVVKNHERGFLLLQRCHPHDYLPVSTRGYGCLQTPHISFGLFTLLKYLHSPWEILNNLPYLNHLCLLVLGSSSTTTSITSNHGIDLGFSFALIPIWCNKKEWERSNKEDNKNIHLGIKFKRDIF